MKPMLLLLLVGLGLLTPVGAQTPPPSGGKFAIGVDLLGITYDHFSVYLEVPVLTSLSVTTAVGYSPAGGWQPGFEYWYFQSELRNYLNPSHRQDFYSGFGWALYLSPHQLDFSRWSPAPAGTSSAIFGAYGLMGYKYFPQAGGSFYLDPGFMLYALAPLDFRSPGGDRGSFFYRPVAPMANVVAGWEF